MSLVNRENLSAKKIDKESPMIGHMKAGGAAWGKFEHTRRQEEAIASICERNMVTWKKLKYHISNQSEKETIW